jgi:hypothetical protein
MTPAAIRPPGAYRRTLTVCYVAATGRQRSRRFDFERDQESHDRFMLGLLARKRHFWEHDSGPVTKEDMLARSREGAQVKPPGAAWIYVCPKCAEFLTGPYRKPPLFPGRCFECEVVVKRPKRYVLARAGKGRKPRKVRHG